MLTHQDQALNMVIVMRRYLTVVSTKYGQWKVDFTNCHRSGHVFSPESPTGFRHSLYDLGTNEVFLSLLGRGSAPAGPNPRTFIDDVRH